MLKYKKLFLLLFTGMFQLAAKAQEALANTAAEEGGFMRSDGKIYVVAAVVVTILAGLIIYVARLDRKITRLEKGNL
jgi:hypothetical protein